jgi:hypothetical protein|tara:strand:- start:286 stop:720 length:435 start_codon:yes stop_codon:yes gene_type:complete
MSLNPFNGLNEFIDELLKQRRISLVVLVVLSLLAILALSGCSSLREAGWVSGTALATGAAASIVTGTLPAVAAGAAVGGITAAVISDAPAALPSSPEQATSGWGALAVLFASSAKWIGLCALVFIVLGWLMPSPFKLNKREKAR